MKSIIKYTIVLLLGLVALSSCRKEEVLNPESVITVDQYTKNAFDLWLESNFVNPYNIQIKYRYDLNETSFSYYTVPADYDNSVILAHLIKYLCIESYDEVAGVLFTKHYFPKLFVFIGEWEYNNAGTIRLGTAEGGKKITLSGVNYIPSIMTGKWGDYPTSGADGINHYYIKTIHHEFTHILNQTKDFTPEFTQITPNDYIQDSWNASEYSSEYLYKGFISRYARKDDREDFAELLSMFVTNPAEQWEAWMASASVDADGNPASGRDIIETKLEIVKNYMKDYFQIDIEELRKVVLRRQAEVFQGLVDLTSLEID
jgi:substrate import-associated zinc metallohydrolase lipoprotein